jgi:hypothetical protein
MDNPENLATLDTQAQDEDNQNKNTTQQSKKIDVFSLYMQGASNSHMTDAWCAMGPWTDASINISGGNRSTRRKPPT